MKALLSFILAVLFCVGSSSTFAFAQYPEKPISVIVPYGAGGGTDTQARLLLKYVEEEIGKPMIVVNRPGAGGEIGLAQLSKANPDGYTLGCIVYPDPLVRSNYMDTQYSMDDFVYIATAVNSPVIFLTGASNPYDDLATFVEETKKADKTITVGIASDAHYLTMQMLSNQSGLKFTPIFFKSGSAALNAVLGGHVDSAAIAVQFGVVGQSSGAKVLAIANDVTIPSLPNVKTFLEQGYDVQVKQSRMLIAPKDLPSEIIDILQKASSKAIQNQELKSKIENIGELYDPLAGETLKEFISKTEDILIPVVRDSAEAFVSGQK